LQAERLVWLGCFAGADVVQYNIYGLPATATPPESTPIDLSNLLTFVPVVTGQAHYTLDLATIPGLLAANGEPYIFAVAAQDGAGNISDFSNVTVITLDETPRTRPQILPSRRANTFVARLTHLLFKVSFQRRS